MERCRSGWRCGSIKGMSTSSRERGVDRHRDRPHEGRAGPSHEREVGRGVPGFVGARARRHGHAARRRFAPDRTPLGRSHRRGGALNGVLWRPSRRHGATAGRPPSAPSRRAPRARQRLDAPRRRWPRARMRTRRWHGRSADSRTATLCVSRRTTRPADLRGGPRANGRRGTPCSTVRPPPTARIGPPAPHVPSARPRPSQRAQGVAGDAQTPRGGPINITVTSPRTAP